MVVIFSALLSTWANSNGKKRTKSNKNWTSVRNARWTRSAGQRPLAFCTCYWPSAARRPSRWSRTCRDVNKRSPNGNTSGANTLCHGRLATSAMSACSRSACTKPSDWRQPTCAVNPIRFAFSSWSTIGCRRTPNTKLCRPRGINCSFCKYNTIKRIVLFSWVHQRSPKSRSASVRLKYYTEI